MLPSLEDILGGFGRFWSVMVGFVWKDGSCDGRRGLDGLRGWIEVLGVEAWIFFIFFGGFKNRIFVWVVVVLIAGG